MNELPPQSGPVLPRLGYDPNSPEERAEKHWHEKFPITEAGYPVRPEAFDLLDSERMRLEAYVKQWGRDSIQGEQAVRDLAKVVVKIGALVEVAERERAGVSAEDTGAEEARIARQMEANRIEDEKRRAGAAERKRLRDERKEAAKDARDTVEDPVPDVEAMDREERLDRVASEFGKVRRGEVVPMRREERRERREERPVAEEPGREVSEFWKARLRWADDLKAEVVPDLLFRVSALWPKVWLSLLNGDGGAGKSTLLTQFFSAMAEGAPVFGRATVACRTMLLSSEEDDDLASRRLNHMPDVGRFPIFNLLDWPMPCELCASLRDGSVVPLPFLAVLREMIGDLRPELVGLDHVGDLFLVNENSKAEVNAALQLLRPLHAEFGVDFVLAQHISKAGMASGRRDAGTPQWSNKARWRAALYPPGLGAEAGEDEVLSALAERHRVLEVMKDNYGGKAGTRVSLLREAWHFVEERGEVEKAKSRSLTEGVLAFVESMTRADKDASWPAAPMAGGSLVVSFRRSFDKRPPEFDAVVAAVEELAGGGRLVRFSVRNRAGVERGYLRLA